MFLPADAAKAAARSDKFNSQLGARRDADKAKKAKGKLARVPAVHFRSASGRVVKPLPGNYFSKENKEMIKKELMAKKETRDFLDEYGMAKVEITEVLPGLVKKAEEADYKGKIPALNLLLVFALSC